MFTATYGTHIAFWRGATSANAPTVQISMQCSQSPSNFYGEMFTLNTPYDANWPEWSFVTGGKDQTVTTAGLSNNGYSSLALAYAPHSFSQ